MGLIPFFVADRPASLKILSELKLKNKNKKIGIMTHAFTTQSFWDLNKKFPFNNKDIVKERNNCALKSENVIKMADSGIFNKNGCNLNYNELFKRYNRLGVEYGIIIDVLKDPDATIKSALLGLKIYNRYRRYYKFKLVAVTQGNNLEEYLKCYEKLIENFDYVAIGGLLRKNENSARFVSVRNESLMYDVIEAIQKDYLPDWSFVLGCYNPSRHKKFEKLGVWGSDYKGWIFNYKTKIESLLEIHLELETFEITNGISSNFKDYLNLINLTNEELQNLKEKRRKTIKKKKRVIYGEIKEIKQILYRYFDEILNKRNKHLNINEKSPEYLDNLNRFDQIMNGYTEQEWRFFQVRKYLENTIITKIS